MQKWMRNHLLAVGSVNSCKIDIFAHDRKLRTGTLDYRSGFLTGVAPVFKLFSISAESVDISLFARLCIGPTGPEVHFYQDLPQDAQAVIDWGQAPLLPFKAKSGDSYIAKIEASVQVRSRLHEDLLNGFYRFLRRLGYSPGYSREIDLALEGPPVIIEAKVIADDGAWTASIRAAVAQLYEYRWFYLPGAELVFLASRPVPDDWTKYLRDCHGIRSAWPEGEGYHVEDLDEIFPQIASEEET